MSRLPDSSTAQLLLFQHFAHPQNTAYIENIVIPICGADDRIHQVLNAIDWNAVNGS